MNRAEAAQKRVDLMRAWRSLFMKDDGTLKPEAVMVLADLEAECFQTRTTASETPIDPYRMAMNEGRRTAFHLVKRRLYEPLEQYVRATEDSQ